MNRRYPTRDCAHAAYDASECSVATACRLGSLPFSNRIRCQASRANPRPVPKPPSDPYTLHPRRAPSFASLGSSAPVVVVVSPFNLSTGCDGRVLSDSESAPTWFEALRQIAPVSRARAAAPRVPARTQRIGALVSTHHSFSWVHGAVMEMMTSGSRPFRISVAPPGSLGPSPDTAKSCPPAK